MLIAPDLQGPYFDLAVQMNASQDDTEGYSLQNPDPSLCRPVTRGTIQEDDIWNPDNSFPFLQHYWVAWGSHEPWWSPFISPNEAVSYASRVWPEAVMEYADGREEEALYDIGRLLHLYEDMGSVPHAYGDSHPDVLRYLDLVNRNWLDDSGFENWCKAHAAELRGSAAIERPATPLEGMERLATEVFRATRIRGEVFPDALEPATGDLATLFPDPDYLLYVPKQDEHGLYEAWHIPGVGFSCTGNSAVGPNELCDLPGSVSGEPNAFYRVPNLPGESGSFFYVENGQERAVPSSVWSRSAGAWVPNSGGLSLAQLWAGAGNLRATPDQGIEVIPRTVERTAGVMQHIWDMINPPPHLAAVRIEQDQDGDGRIDPAAGELVYDRRWRDAGPDGTGARTGRWLGGASGPAALAPATITLFFSEPVRDVVVALGRDRPTLEAARGASSVPGPPTRDHPQGEPTLRLRNVDLAALPPGPITLFVTAEDLSAHLGTGCSHLDPDPSTRAGRLPDASWRFYLEEGGEMPDTDRTHRFDLGGFQVRATPAELSGPPGSVFAHAVEARNLSLEPGTEVALSVKAGDARGWVTDAAEVDGSVFPLPPPDTGWQPAGLAVTLQSPAGYPGRITVGIDAVAGENDSPSTIRDWTTDDPINDHPDDTRFVGDPRYPTPWIVDPAAPLGVLLSGWGQGLGHLLGAYGIPTAPVSPDLEAVGGAPAGLASLRALFVGSGGLADLGASPSLRGRLADFVAGGGMLVALTPQRGAELAALPGGEVAGFGWGEDQACFGMAARVAARHVVLAGQESPWLDAGADGYLTHWPEDAEVLLERTSNGQPAMIRYPYGSGEVFVLTLYPDWGYGAGQSSPAERALVRDLATYALARPAPVPEFDAGEPVALAVPVANASPSPTATVRIEARTSDRAPLEEREVALPLGLDEVAEVPFDLAPPPTLGIHPVSCDLLDAGGTLRQEGAGAAFFAVRAPFAVPEPAAGVRLWVTAVSDAVPRGGSARAVVHVRNDTEREIAGTVAATWTHLGAGPLVSVPGLALPPGEGADVPLEYPAVAPYDFTLAYGFFEEGVEPEPGSFYERSLAHAMKGFAVFAPGVAVELAAEGATLLSGHPVSASARLTSLSGDALPLELLLSLRSPANLEVWTEKVEVEAAPGAEHAFALDPPAGEWGTYTLEAEVRIGAAVVGRAARFLSSAPPSLVVEGRHALPLRAAGELALAYALRNDEPVALGGGELRAELVDAAGAVAWTGTAPVPPLAPGASTLIPFAPVIPHLAQGDWRLRHVAQLPEGDVSGALPLRHLLAAAITASGPTARAGELLGAEASIENTGDFLVEGLAVLEAEGPGASCEAALALAPGQRVVLPCVFTLPADLPPGPVALTLSGAGTVLARTSVGIPDPRLRMLPPPEEAAAGEGVELTLVNAGGSAGAFDFTVRLTSADGDAGAPQLAQTGGSCDLPAGASCTATLALPPAIRGGIHLLTLASTERHTGRDDAGAAHLLVHGASAALTVAAGQAAYAAGDPLTALATVTNGPQPLEGATLELAVTGSGGIDPPAFTGTVHVAPGGDDVAGDGSASSPFATPQRGIDAAPAGARVLLHAGTYAGQTLQLRPGTVLQGEVVAGAPAARVEDAEIVGASGTVLDHLALSRASVHFPAAVTGVRVSDCALADLDRAVDGTWSGIVFAGAADDVLVARTSLTRASGAARPGIVFHGPAARVRILGSDFSALAADAASGVQLFAGASDVLVQGNAFSGLAGGSAGVHLANYADAEPLRDVRVLGNRLADLDGDCGGIHLWSDAEGIEVRGNEIADLDGDCSGIHLWGQVTSGTVADNRIERLRGNAVGLHVWGWATNEHRDVAIGNNLVEDLGPLAAGDRDNGIQVWERTTGLRVTGNLVSAATDDAPDLQHSGLVVSGSGSTGVLVDRNVVRDSSVGIALRLEGRGPPPGEAGATVANNLLLGNGVGLLEETLVDGGNSLLRDNIVAGSAGAGIRYENPDALAPTSRLAHNDLFANGAATEGLPDPAGSDGNLAADPLLVDPDAGDFRTQPDSPCRDAGSFAGLDIGPLDEDLAVTIGPGRTPVEDLEVTHWASSVPVDAPPGESVDIEAAPGPLPAAGQLLLRGVLRAATGEVLARAASPFAVDAGPLGLSLATARETWLPGETIPVTVTARNRGAGAIAGETLSVLAGGAEVFATALDLGPGEVGDFAFETSADRDVLLEASAGLASATLAITVAAPRVELDVSAPEVVGYEPFTLAARVANPGAVPLGLSVDLAGEALPLVLAAGEEQVLGRTMSVAADAVLVVRCGGDAEAVVAREVRCGVAPRVAVDAAPRYEAGPVTVPVAIANAGTVGAELPLRVELRGGEGEPRLVVDTSRWAAPGGTAVVDAPLGILGPGLWSLRAEAAGVEATAGFEVLSAVGASILSADTGAGPDGNGELPIEVRVGNAGARPFEGVLVVSLGGRLQERPVSCAVDGEGLEDFTLPLDGLAAGEHPLRIALLGNGEVQDELVLAVRLAPELRIADAPAEVAVAAGEPGAVTIEVRNDGPVPGVASLVLSGGGFLDGNAVAAVPARSSVGATVGFTLPGDLPDGLVVPATVSLTDLAGGPPEERPLALLVSAPAALRASAALDAPAYADGAEGGLTVWLSNDGGGSLPLGVLVSSGGQRSWTGVVVGAAAAIGGLEPDPTGKGLALAPGETGGTLVSAALDAVEASTVVPYWGATVPEGATLLLELRAGPGPTPDATWSAWSPLAAGEPPAGVAGRFLQYRATFAASADGESPLLRWIDLDCTPAGRYLYHSGPEELQRSPLVLELPFTVDFAAGDQVHVGAYAETGRALYLDTLPIPRAVSTFAIAPDSTRVACGGAVSGWVWTFAPGRLEVSTPWESASRDFPSATSWPFSFAVPGLLRTGSYELRASFLGETVSLPVEVLCHELLVLAAATDRGAYLVGEEVRLAVDVAAPAALAGVTVDAWLSDGRSTVPVAAETRDLPGRPDRVELRFPLPSGPSGPLRLEFAFHLGDGAEPRALFLAGGEVGIDRVAPNLPPVAAAGPDAAVVERSWLTLDGSASSDPDGDPLSFRWEQVAGPAAAIYGAATARPLLLAPEVRPPGGGLELRLTVSDGHGGSASDTVAVAIGDSNRPPRADAGADVTCTVGTTATLDGSLSHDPDGDLLSFAWELTLAPPGSAATVDDPEAVLPGLPVDRPGDYEVLLTVSDGIASDTDVVHLSTRNSRPVADAGDDRRALPGRRETLDGSASEDADGDPLGFAWELVERPEGSAAMIEDGSSARASLVPDLWGRYAAQLVVDDGELASAPDEIVLSCENATPVADAGPDRAVRVGQEVALNGSGSNDPDGDPLTWRWAFTALPDGSAATLDDAASPAPAFTADREGTYAVTLVVGDGFDESDADGAVVTAGTDVAEATVRLRPRRVRLGRLPRSLRVSIEPPEGFAASEIDPGAAALVSVGARTLARPVRPLAAKGWSLEDSDGDGRQELVLFFPVRPIRRRLRAGRRARLGFAGPLVTSGRFVGTAALRVLR